MGEDNVMYTHKKFHSALKRKEIYDTATTWTWTNPEDIMHSEISQTQKDKHGRILLT